MLNKWLMLAVAALLALYNLIVLCTPTSFFTELVMFCQLLCTFMVTYVTIRLGMPLHRGRLQSLLAFGGIFLFTALTVNDALALNNLPCFGAGNMLPTGTLLFMLAYMLILAANTAEKEREMELTKLRMENQLALQAERFEQLAESVEQSRRVRHDLRHHMSVISAYLEADNQTALMGYLADYTGSLPADDDPPYCLNLSVDAVVRHYLSRARNDGAVPDIRLQLPQRAGVSDADLCIVFGNIFENAALAVERQTEGEKFIMARCETDENKMVLTVDNSVDPLEKPREGIGLQSVTVVAERNGGGALFERNEGVFQSSVQLNTSQSMLI